VAKAAFTRKKTFHQQIGLKFKDETSEVLHLERFFYGADTWTLRKVDQKCLESFEMRCWRRMEKISGTDRLRYEEVLHGVKEERNILHTAKKKEG
jgi:hypothetical protein